MSAPGAQTLAPLKGATLAVTALALALGTFMQVLDTTIANIALPYMQGSVSASQAETAWVLTRMAKKLNLQESRAVISCLYSLTACRPVEFWGDQWRRSWIREQEGENMEWTRILAYITGTVDQELTFSLWRY